MQILLTGGTGFIGTALTASLHQDGHHLTVLTRQAGLDDGHCRYVRALDELPADSRFDAIINLAGASLAGRRWSKAYKREILASRLDTTRDLVRLVQRLEDAPEVMLSASAIGYYGHHEDEALAEDAAVVPGFAQDLCQQWEDVALQAADHGVRVCLLRLGVVLGRDGGAMVEMARPFRFGVANWLGSGQQWLSWVHRQDVIRAIRFLLEAPELSGAFNVTAPNPVTSRGFCDTMKRHRRTLVTLPMPGPVMRLMVGEMADELLLSGQRVIPAALGAAGFEFTFPELDEALADIL